MTRVIEVSHWGNIAVEETYDLIHSGAVLKGPFSRYEYQRHQDGVSSVKSFKVCRCDAYTGSLQLLEILNLKLLREFSGCSWKIL